MKRSLALLFVLAATAGISFAQNITVGAKGGLSIPNLTAGGTNSPLSEGYKSRLGTDFGIYVEKHFTARFSVSVGLEYSEQGGKKTGFQALPSAQILTPINQAITGGLAQAGITGVPMPETSYLYSDFTNTAKLNYLMIPVLARFSWSLGHSSPVKFYASAGPFVGFLVKAQQVTSASSTIYFDAQKTKIHDVYRANLASEQIPAYVAEQILNSIPFDQLALTAQTTNIKPDTHTVNAGIMGFVGFSYNIGPNAIFIEGGGNYGLMTIQKDDVNGKNRIGAGVVTMGYAYTF